MFFIKADKRIIKRIKVRKKAFREKLKYFFTTFRIQQKTITFNIALKHLNHKK